MAAAPANLVIRLTKLGDLIYTTPVYRAFKESFPDQPLHLLTDDIFSSAINHDPHIDKIIRLPWHGSSHPSWFSVYQTLKASGPYQRAAILQANFEGLNWVTAFLGIKEVAQIGGTIGALLFRHAYILRGDHKDGRHISEQLLDVAKKLGATTADSSPCLYVTDAERTAVLDKFPSLREPNKLLVHPFCVTAVANPSPQSFFDYCRYIADHSPYRIYIAGTKQEMEGLQFPEHPKISFELAGHTSLRELMAVCTHMDLVLGGSSGVIHIAAAMGAATLGLYCPGNNPIAWGSRGPWAKNLTSPPELCRRLGAKTGPCQSPSFCNNAFGFTPEKVLAEISSLIAAKSQATLKT